MAAFATAADLADFLGRDDFTGNEADQAALLLDVASDQVRRWARQTVDLVVDDEVTLAGTWARELVLPERPVVSVGAVSVNGTALTADVDYVVSGGVLYAGPRVTSGTLSAGWPCWQGAGGRAHWHWGGPDSVVAVIYTHGFDPVPDSVVGAVLAMAARALTSPTGVRQESIAGYSVTYADTAAGVRMAGEEMSSLSWLRRRAA